MYDIKGQLYFLSSISQFSSHFLKYWVLKLKELNMKNVLFGKFQNATSPAF